MAYVSRAWGKRVTNEFKQQVVSWTGFRPADVLAISTESDSDIVDSKCYFFKRGIFDLDDLVAFTAFAKLRSASQKKYYTSTIADIRAYVIPHSHLASTSGVRITTLTRKPSLSPNDICIRMLKWLVSIMPALGGTGLIYTGYPLKMDHEKLFPGSRILVHGSTDLIIPITPEEDASGEMLVEEDEEDYNDE